MQRHWQDFLEVRTIKLYYNFHSSQSVSPGEINGALRMLKVVSSGRIRSPVSKTPEIQLRPRMLQQDLHGDVYSVQMR